MYDAKTKVTEVNALDFINNIEKERKREDSLVIHKMMSEVTGEVAKMWGPSIIGFGSYHYKYASGHEGIASRLGFAPGKSNHLSLYVLTEDDEKQRELLSRLGKYRSSKACLYINKLDDVNLGVLRELIQHAWDWMNEKYPN